MFIISLAFISITKGIVIIALSSLRTCQQTHAEFRPPPPTPSWLEWAGTHQLFCQRHPVFLSFNIQTLVKVLQVSLSDPVTILFGLLCSAVRSQVLVISFCFCCAASPIMTNQIQNSIPLSHSSAVVYFWNISTSLGKGVKAQAGQWLRIR